MWYKRKLNLEVGCAYLRHINLGKNHHRRLEQPNNEAPITTRKLEWIRFFKTHILFTRLPI